METKKAILTKLETLPNAEHPQEEKYPSGKTIRTGILVSGLPTIGDSFTILKEDNTGFFQISIVKNIEKINENTMILTTLNSKYKLELSYEQIKNSN